MGDRANVAVVQHDGKSLVYLYTHWAGTELPETVRQSLMRATGGPMDGNRWGDEQYLARIIFCEMVKGQELATSGYGISSLIGDGDYRIVEVNPKKQTVRLIVDGKELKAVPMAEFVMSEQSWPEDT